MKQLAVIAFAVAAIGIFASESNAQCRNGGVRVYSAPVYRSSVTYGRPAYGYNLYRPSYSVYRTNSYVVPVYRGGYPVHRGGIYHPYGGYNVGRSGVYYRNGGYRGGSGFGINIRF